jgi:hypothetical protein
MSDFLTQEECAPNLNSATIAGKVIKVEALSSKTPGLRVTIGYQKTWQNGGTQEIPISCYVSGAERIAQLDWLKVGEVVVIHGEVTDKGSVYAHLIERPYHVAREPGEDDAFLAGMQRSQHV